MKCRYCTPSLFHFNGQYVNIGPLNLLPLSVEARRSMHSPRMGWGWEGGSTHFTSVCLENVIDFHNPFHLTFYSIFQSFNDLFNWHLTMTGNLRGRINLASQICLCFQDSSLTEYSRITTARILFRMANS